MPESGGGPEKITGCLRFLGAGMNQAAFKWEEPEPVPVRCRVCNRVLTAPKSVEAGMGPGCRRRLKRDAGARAKFLEKRMNQNG